MAVRVRYKVEVSVSSTTAEEKDLGNVKYEVVDDAQGEGGTWKTVLAAASSNVQIQLDNIATARFLLFKTNAKDPTQAPGIVQIKKNSTGGEIMEIKPLGTNKEGHFLMSTDSITAIYASNPGAVVMELTVIACGD